VTCDKSPLESGNGELEPVADPYAQPSRTRTRDMVAKAPADVTQSHHGSAWDKARQRWGTPVGGEISEERPEAGGEHEPAYGPAQIVFGPVASLRAAWRDYLETAGHYAEVWGFPGARLILLGTGLPWALLNSVIHPLHSLTARQGRGWGAVLVIILIVVANSARHHL
jgi:hypothetical protein